LERKELHISFGGETEGEKPLGRPRNRWQDNIITDLKYVRWEGVDWIGLAKDRDRWRVVVETVTIFGLHKVQGIS
jgi:hypothetical protein